MDKLLLPQTSSPLPSLAGGARSQTAQTRQEEQKPWEEDIETTLSAEPAPTLALLHRQVSRVSAQLCPPLGQWVPSGPPVTPRW